MNITKETLKAEMNKDGSITCPFCGKYWDSENSDQNLSECIDHCTCDHNYEILSTEESLNGFATEHKPELDNWLEKKKIEIIQNCTNTEREIMLSDASDTLLKNKVEQELWRTAFRQKDRLSTLDTKIMDSICEGKTKLPPKEIPVQETTEIPETAQRALEQNSEDSRRKKELLIVLKSLLRKRGN